VTPKLFFDEDACNDVVVSALRKLGIDVLTVIDAGRLKGDDEAQLRYATSLGRAIYSLNTRDFSRLHAEFLGRCEHHAGVILIPRQRYSVGTKIRKLGELCDMYGAEELKNTIHYL
jgi:Domain of unknown function (DUF5615)